VKKGAFIFPHPLSDPALQVAYFSDKKQVSHLRNVVSGGRHSFARRINVGTVSEFICFIGSGFYSFFYKP